MVDERKLDGVRAWWDGTGFLSRLGNPYLAPAWFTAALPSFPLDGELWLERKQFQRCCVSRNHATLPGVLPRC